MAAYEYGHVKKLAKALADNEVDPAVTERILAGGESVRKTDKPEKKARWMIEAMDRMDSLLDVSTRRAVREACACCLGGKRFEISRDIGRNCKTLEEAIKACDEAKYVFGHSVKLEQDGTVIVSFEAEGKECYGCVCLPKRAPGPVSETYCYCCGGHIKSHLQRALNRKLSCTVVHTALSTGGKTPCTFSFAIEQ